MGTHSSTLLSLSSLTVFFPSGDEFLLAIGCHHNDIFIGSLAFIILPIRLPILANRTPDTRLDSYKRPRENTRKITSNKVIKPWNTTCSPGCLPQLHRGPSLLSAVGSVVGSTTQLTSWTCTFLKASQKIVSSSTHWEPSSGFIFFFKELPHSRMNEIRNSHTLHWKDHDWSPQQNSNHVCIPQWTQYSHRR